MTCMLQLIYLISLQTMQASCVLFVIYMDILKLKLWLEFKTG